MLREVLSLGVIQSENYGSVTGIQLGYKYTKTWQNIISKSVPTPLPNLHPLFTSIAFKENQMLAHHPCSI